MSRNEFKKLTDKRRYETFLGRKNEKYLIHKNSHINKVGPFDVQDEDFFISTTASGTWLTYKTDTYRRVDLQPYVETIIQNTNEIVRNGRDFYITANFIDDEITPSTLIRLVNCQIFNNQLIFDSVEELVLPIGRFHGSAFHRDYLYLITRPLGVSGYSTSVRVNAEMTEVKTLTLTGSTQYMGRPTDIVCLSGDAYTIIGRDGSTPAYFIKINGDMSAANILFALGDVVSTKRIRAQSPFLIYNNEIYVPTSNNSSQPLAGNSMGLAVYNFAGVIQREVAAIPISTGETARPFPHWMGIFGGKVIISVSSSASPHKFLIRFDCLTLAKEEQLDLDIAVTDDNSIFTDGYMYINGEITSDMLTPQLLKVKYNDFTDVTIEIVDYNNGAGSHGSLNPVLNV